MTQQKPVASRTALALRGPAPERGRYLRITMYIRKLPGITDDYFHAYWANNHREAALANSTFAAKIRRYSQVSSAGGDVEGVAVCVCVCVKRTAVC